jgi:hypothetical protein
VKCRRCGHENELGANYCSSCGTPLSGDEETTLTLAAIEDRQAIEEELGAALTELAPGVGLLVVRRGPNAGSTYVLDRDETTLGRHPDSNIFLDDVTVSRRHARVRRLEGRYELDDVGSLNGTYVDHRRIDTATLHDLAEVQVGRYVLTFVLGGPEGAGTG